MAHILDFLKHGHRVPILAGSEESKLLFAASDVTPLREISKGAILSFVFQATYAIKLRMKHAVTVAFIEATVSELLQDGDVMGHTIPANSVHACARRSRLL